MIAVRLAEQRDAEAISAVLVASITELCIADHHSDPDILARWLANKMPQTIAPWFANASNTVLIAQRDGQVAAVGAYNASREIILNYVAPAHRFAGVSTALLAAIERLLGPGEARLNSTLTAQNFYRQRGWVETGRVESWAGMASPEMRKMLRSI